MAVEAGQCSVGSFPAMLALTFGATGLEGFQPSQGFDQEGLAFGAEDPCSLYVTELFGETVWRIPTAYAGAVVPAWEGTG